MKRFFIFMLTFFFALNLFPQSIDIHQDLNYFMELLTQGYVCYDEIEEDNSFRNDKFIEDVTKEYLEFVDTCKSTDEQQDLFADILFTHMYYNIPIADRHFVIESPNYVFYQNTEYWYYSSILLEKDQNSYTVFSSNEKNIKKRMQYTGNEENLFRCIIDGKELYRFGILTSDYINEFYIQIDNHAYKIPVYCEEPATTEKPSIFFTETEKSIYLSLKDCYFDIQNEKEHLNMMALYNECLNKIVNSSKKNIIIDLRGNKGGYISNVDALIPSIYCKYDNKLNRDYSISKKNNYSYYKTMMSPVTVRKYSEMMSENEGFSIIERDKVIENEKNVQDEQRKYYVNENTEKKEVVKIKNTLHEGIVILLIDKHTSSAAEELISLFDLIETENLYILGTNSMGALDYPGALVYELPSSKLHVYFSIASTKDMPCLRNNIKWHNDNKGFYPDYWTTNTEIKNTVISLTKDKKLKKVLRN